MADGVNLVVLVGNLGRDPDVREMPSGGSVAEISLATTRSWKNKTSGKKEKRTEWHRVTFFNRVAEVVGEYATSGTQMYVQGEIRTEKWQDRATGADRYTVKIIAEKMQLLGGSRAGAPVAEQSAEEDPVPF